MAESVAAEKICRPAGETVEAGETAFGSSDDFGAPYGLDGIKVTVRVRNNGKAATQEVLQVYVKDENDADDVTNAHLSAFERIDLAAGEEKEIVLTVRPHELASVDENGDRRIRTDKFKVYAGFSQPDARSKELTGHACAECEVDIR